MMSSIKQKLSKADMKWFVSSILFLVAIKAAASLYFGGEMTFEPIAVFIILWSSYIIGIKAKIRKKQDTG